MNNLSIIIDMDKVVFQTSLFISDISNLLEEKFNINRELFNSQVPNFYKKGTGNLRHYDFFEHITSIGLNSDQVESTILNSFSKKDYSYSDVLQFLDFIHIEIETDNITLLTYGQTRFQQLKFSCAPTLHKLNYIDTMQPKTEFIKINHPDGYGVIIDDKIIDNLPSNFKQIRLTRPDAYPNGNGLKSLYEIENKWKDICETIG